MLTKIDLCSMALLKLGEAPIQSLTDDSAAAQLSRTLFDTVVDALMSLHPWRFATQQLELIKNTDGNFLIPSNVLRVLRSDGRVIGDRIVCSSDKINIIAITKDMKNNPDPEIEEINRKMSTAYHNKDIITGKIANDSVGETVAYVVAGVMRKEDALERLRFQKRQGNDRPDPGHTQDE